MSLEFDCYPLSFAIDAAHVNDAVFNKDFSAAFRGKFGGQFIYRAFALMHRQIPSFYNLWLRRIFVSGDALRVIFLAYRALMLAVLAGVAIFGTRMPGIRAARRAIRGPDILARRLLF